jgi:hypothetical protein
MRVKGRADPHLVLNMRHVRDVFEGGIHQTLLSQPARVVIRIRYIMEYLSP